MNPGAPEPIVFHYRFQFRDGSAREFAVRLDPQTLALVDRPAGPPPEWTRLDNNRCVNCPLAGKADYCPVAVNLSHVVETFKDSVWYDQALVTVRTKERTYQHDTSVQRGLSSIIGIYNVTSGCPILDRLRPMVRFHLPFASTDETVYRTVSMYLTAQYFVMARGGAPDWTLADLAGFYDAMALVEEGLSRRFREASRSDANVNAVIILAAFGQEISLLLGGRLKDIEYRFDQYRE